MARIEWVITAAVAATFVSLSLGCFVPCGGSGDPSEPSCSGSGTADEDEAAPDEEPVDTGLDDLVPCEVPGDAAIAFVDLPEEVLVDAAAPRLRVAVDVVGFAPGLLEGRWSVVVEDSDEPRWSSTVELLVLCDDEGVVLPELAIPLPPAAVGRDVTLSLALEDEEGTRASTQTTFLAAERP